MARKIVLEIEELEERIAPHYWLGGGHSPVYIHDGEIGPTADHRVDIPAQAEGAIDANAARPPINPPGNAVGRP